MRKSAKTNLFFKKEPEIRINANGIKKEVNRSPHKHNQKQIGCLERYIQDEVVDVLEELHGHYSDESYDASCEENYMFRSSSL